MQKTILKPLDRPFARGVAVDTGAFTRVSLSGAVSDETDSDLEDQTAEIFATLQAYLEELDGGLADLVRVRVYINESLDSEAYEQVNAARRDYFQDERHYPASTVLEISGLVSDDYAIEVDAEAIIPADEWDVTVVD